MRCVLVENRSNVIESFWELDPGCWRLLLACIRYTKKRECMKISEPRPGQIGLTLVEILVAMLLMGVVFLIGWTVSNSFVGVRRVRNFETAIMLANQTIEAVRTARFRDIGEDGSSRKDTLLADFSSAKSPFDGAAGEGFVPVATVNGVEFRRDVSVKNLKSKIPDMEAGVKLVRVLISWKSSDDGMPTQFEVVTTHADDW